jgi:hypothetical protein
MNTASTAAFVAVMLIGSAACACSVEELRKLLDDHLERLPGGREHEVGSWKFSAEGGSWQMFERENATPHSIVITYMGETGQAKERISFLNRHDFAIAKTQIDYAQPMYDPKWAGDFKVEPSQLFFFCENKPVAPADLNAAEEAMLTSEAEKIRHHIFDDLTMLKVVLDRVPEHGP